MEQIRVKRGTDQKVHFSIFDDALNLRPIDLSVFFDIHFEVFNSSDKTPIIKKTMGTNGIAFRECEDGNQVTIFLAADDTLRFGANGIQSPNPRLYRLTGIKSNGERQMINEGFFYSEPCGGGANVLCID